MKVILLQDVKKMGNKGDVLEVAEGYARNYLFPRKLAVEATRGQMKNLEVKKAGEQRKKAKILEDAKKLAARVEDLTVTISTKVGEGGRLFGSITGKDIADAIKVTHGIEIDRKKIDLENPIKSLGSFSVSVKLHPEVLATFAVQVVEE